MNSKCRNNDDIPYRIVFNDSIFLNNKNDVWCEIPDLASIATLPTEVGDGLEEQDTYSP